jgi:hypothetical protein
MIKVSVKTVPDCPAASPGIIHPVFYHDIPGDQFTDKIMYRWNSKIEELRQFGFRGGPRGIYRLNERKHVVLFQFGGISQNFFQL